MKTARAAPPCAARRGARPRCGKQVRGLFSPNRHTARPTAGAAAVDGFKDHYGKSGTSAASKDHYGKSGTSARTKNSTNTTTMTRRRATSGRETRRLRPCGPQQGRLRPRGTTPSAANARSGLHRVRLRPVRATPLRQKRHNVPSGLSTVARRPAGRGAAAPVAVRVSGCARGRTHPRFPPPRN